MLHSLYPPKKKKPTTTTTKKTHTILWYTDTSASIITVTGDGEMDYSLHAKYQNGIKACGKEKSGAVQHNHWNSRRCFQRSIKSITFI